MTENKEVAHPAVRYSYGFSSNPMCDVFIPHLSARARFGPV